MQALGNDGPKYTLEHKSKTYTASFIGDWERAWYEKWMKQSILEEIENDEDATEEQKQKDRIYVKEKIRNGVYKWGGKKWEEARHTPEGQVRLFWMLLAREHPALKYNEVIEIIDEHPNECQCILALVSIDSLVNSVKEIPRGKKEEALSRIYAKMIQPIEAGGMGIPMEIVAKYTDIQKVEILTQNLKQEDKPPTEPYTPEAKENILQLMRKQAG